MRLRLPHQGLRAAIALFLLSLTALPAAAQTICDSHGGRLADVHTREQLKQFVVCAARHIETVGWEQAALDFESNAWWEHPLYLFATRADGRVLLSPGVDLEPGANVWDLQDADGLYLAREQVRVSRDFGGGYVYLRFENPQSGRVEPAITWVQAIEHEGDLAYVGAALYGLTTHAACPPDTVRAALVYSERDVERFVTCAEHYLRQNGLRALHDFNRDPRWTSGPIYLFLIDRQTLVRAAHGGEPGLVGVAAGAQPDPDGVYIAREMRRALGAHDDGYFYYRRLNPASGAVERKVSYVRRVLLDGRAWMLGAGLYLPAEECRDLPPARDIDTRDELQQYVRCAAQLVDERGEAAFELFINHSQWLGGAIYLFALDANCDYLATPYPQAGVNNGQCDFTDVEGAPVDEEIRARVTGEAGEGWVRYVIRNPASGQVEGKESYVVGVTLNGELISLAAGLYESQLE